MKDLSCFIDKTSLQRTLSNRLIPVEKTQDFITHCGLLAEDEARAEKREELKVIMDDFYRYFLGKTLVKCHVEWDEFFKVLKASRTSAVEDGHLKKLQDEMRTRIHVLFTKEEQFSNLFCGKFISDVLPDFVKHYDGYSEQEKLEKLEVVNMFACFTTSFTDFFNNRANVFLKDPISTSVCFRVVHDNAEIFLDNMEAFSKIYADMPEIIDIIEEQQKQALGEWSLSHLFVADYYNYVLVQAEIDRYNEICGAVNQTVNLYCQKNKLNKNLYKLRRLHKQILSQTTSSFAIPRKYESDEELYESLNGFLGELRRSGFYERLNRLVEDVNQYDYEKIYVPAKEYTNVSQFLCKDWSVFREALKSYYYETISGKGKSKDDKVEKAVKADKYRSLKEIEMMIQHYTKKEIVSSVTEYIASIKTVWEGKTVELIEGNPTVNLIEDEDKISEIKTTLDWIQHIYQWTKIFLIEDTREKDVSFYVQVTELNDVLEPITALYNCIRNYVTQKPYKTEKIKLNFGTPTLADGWSKSKEYSNNATLFRRNGKYYLGIFNPKNKPEKTIMEGHEVRNAETDYEKMVYNLLPGPNKMLPKVFISSKKGVETYHPSDELLSGYNDKKHIKSSKTFSLAFCHELIDFFKSCIAIHPEWKQFGFQFSETSSYADISEFYKEVAEQGYKLNFVYLTEDEMNALVDSGKLYLFQIYNKDFAERSKGTKNLHTMYFEYLFHEDNLKDVVLKLNGQAEIFFRRSSIKKPIVHKKGSILVNRTYAEPIKVIDDDGNEQEEIVYKHIPDAVYGELYAYYNNRMQINALSDATKVYLDKCEHYPATMDIVKDRRYTVDQYFFHCPLTINFKANESWNVNEAVLRYIAESEDINVIGIDRGERNLIYVTLIDAKGNVKKQKSYNIVKQYDYREKLDAVEHARQDARRNWKEIGKIKELKEGYLSLVIHEIATMIVENNAIVVMEDLNFGFKRGRFKVEKQVYQKFETMLISKLEYLVDKKKPVLEDGGLLRGYQLTYQPDSLTKVGRQCGIIFYVPAAYTSKIDPTTGFVDVFRHNELTSGSMKKEFLLAFDEIHYDASKDMFCYRFDYNNFSTYQNKLAKTKWTVYTNDERVESKNVNGRWEDTVIELTKELKLALSGVNYEDGHNLIEDIRHMDVRADLNILNKLQYIFRLTVKMRNSKTKDESYDRIISPVINESGTFFDSSMGCETLPKDADANGAYHIALKGLYTIGQIQKYWVDGKKMKSDVLKITNETWFDYTQNKRYKE